MSLLSVLGHVLPPLPHVDVPIRLDLPSLDESLLAPDRISRPSGQIYQPKDSFGILAT